MWLFRMNSCCAKLTGTWSRLARFASRSSSPITSWVASHGPIDCRRVSRTFSSPYKKTYVPPAGTTPEEAQAIAEHTGNVVIRPETAQALAQQARAIAQDPAVAASGGVAAASPAFQQQEGQAVSAAQQEVG